MKKHNEGYALAFVLVVMVVLCLVAVSILSVSLNNLKNQQQMVQRMQDKYTAQGDIEKVIGALENKIQELENGPPKIAALSETVVKQVCQENGVDGADVELGYYPGPGAGDEAQDYVYFKLASKVYDTIKITCTITITGDIDPDLLTNAYNIDNPVFGYGEYNIIQEVADDGS